MNYAKSVRIATLSLILTGSPAVVYAQEGSDSIYAPCSAIADDKARLACFDTTFARERVIITQRVEQKLEVEINEFGLTPKQVRERNQARSDLSEIPGKEGSSGKTVVNPSNDLPIAELTRQTDEKADVKINAMVSEVLSDSLGNYVIILDNGQIWRSTSNKSFRGRVKTGWQVEISKIWSGGYRLTFEEKSGFIGVTRMR